MYWRRSSVSGATVPPTTRYAVSVPCTRSGAKTVLTHHPFSRWFVKYRPLPRLTSTVAGAHSFLTTHRSLLVMNGRYSDAGDSMAGTKRGWSQGVPVFHLDGPVPWEPPFRIGVAVEQHDRGVEPVHGNGRR